MLISCKLDKIQEKNFWLNVTEQTKISNFYYIANAYKKLQMKDLSMHYLNTILNYFSQQTLASSNQELIHLKAEAIL